jgi:hypothetical protein
MSDQPGAIPLGLAQQKAAKNVDPEQLEAMGKRAAALYSSQGTQLSEAVVETVKEARLAPEQVKRVCEFANTNAYLSEFEKAGEVRNVTFVGGPASPAKVLQDLNDGSSPAVHQVKTAAYLPPSGHYKTAGASDSILAEAFGAGMEKTAEAVPHHARHQPGEELADLRSRLEGVHEHYMSKLSSSEIFLNDIKNDLCEAGAQQVMDGSTLGDVVRAWSSFGDTRMVKEATQLLRDHLRQRRIMDKEQMDESLSKTASAGVVPNPAHPVIDRFLIFTKVAHEHRKLEHSIRIVDEQLNEVNGKLGVR